VFSSLLSIYQANSLPVSGKKDDVVERVAGHLRNKALEEEEGAAP